MEENSPNFDVDDPRYRITPTQQMLSSCFGALTTSVMVTPLDVVKIRLQVQQNTMPSHRCFIYCNGLMDHCIICVNGSVRSVGTLLKEQWYKRPGHFNGTADAFIKIAKTEGLASLWSGLSPTLVLAVPATVVYFTTYEQLRFFIKERQMASKEGSFLGRQPVWISALVAGTVARTFAVTLVNPLELIRTKMQSKKLSHQEVRVAVKRLIQSQGWLSLWQGLTPSLLRDVPFSAIYWSCYETYKTYLPSSELTIWESFVGGALAGSLAAVVTLPFDVVKTLRQIEFGERQTSSDKVTNQKASSTKEIIQRIYHQRGVSGLFAGLVPRVSKVAPACAVMIASYEYGRHFFSRYNQKSIQ